MTAGDFWIMELPKEVNLLNGAQTGFITKKDDPSIIIASSEFLKPGDTWQVKITLDSLVDDVSEWEIEGRLRFIAVTRWTRF